MKYFYLSIFILAHFQSSAQQPVDVLNSMNSGNWEECTQLIEKYFQGKGIFSSTQLRWDKGAFTQLFNTYNGNSSTDPVISVAGFADKQNVWTYWDFWSKQLTDSTWKPKSFFKNKKEALILAQYNVLVLLSHEFGHHLADRYKVDPTNLNCKEFEADKISYGFEVWLAQDPTFISVQDRYRALLIQLHDSGSSKSKFGYKTYLELSSNCACIDVQYPTNSSLMSQYASAFFVRREALYQNKGQFSFESHINENHLASDNKWKHQFPAMPLVCKSQNKIENRYTLSGSVKFAKGVKLMQAWGDGFNQQIEMNGYGFDSTGHFYNIQVNINKLISQGDLWDFRLYDSASNLVDVWYSIPAIMDSIGYAKIQSVFINDVHNDLAVIIDLSRNSEKHNFYLLSPSKDRLTLDWHWLSSENPEGLCIVDQILSDSSSKFTISSFDPIKHFPTKDNTLPIKIDQVSLPKIVSPLKIENVCSNNENGGTVIFSAPNYLMGIINNDIYTLAGNGLDGERFENQLIEIPKVIALRNVGNVIYSAHEWDVSGDNKFIIVRKQQLR